MRFFEVFLVGGLSQWIGNLRCRSNSQAPIQLCHQPASKIKPIHLLLGRVARKTRPFCWQSGPNKQTNETLGVLFKRMLLYSCRSNLCFFPKTTSAASSDSFRELLPQKILHKCPIDLRKEMSAQFSMRSLPQKCLVFKSVFSNKHHSLGGLDGHDWPNEKCSYPFSQNHGKVKITLNETKHILEIHPFSTEP